ncbi:hypothetical protein [uncultured Novosphingobium sp.]|uniref:hypothetical protein n=1 Tax=uncultured Novosphingobium sp. TaxID=292277 RepID=UPI00258979C6|nr:hypothetical protein [uncultured Novosphingobium sp.]
MTASQASVELCGGVIHGVPLKPVRTYKRTSFMQMRRMLLEAWGTYVAKPEDKQT